MCSLHGIVGTNVTFTLYRQERCLLKRWSNMCYLGNIACLEVLKMLVAEIFHFIALIEAGELILILNEPTIQRSYV